MSDLVTGVSTFRIGDPADYREPSGTADGSDPAGRDDDTVPGGSAATPADGEACSFLDLWCLEWPFDLHLDDWF